MQLRFRLGYLVMFMHVLSPVKYLLRLYITLYSLHIANRGLLDTIEVVRYLFWGGSVYVGVQI